jgi:hypothetical protein
MLVLEFRSRYSFSKPWVIECLIKMFCLHQQPAQLKVNVAHLRQQCHISKSVIFLEGFKRLK